MPRREAAVFVGSDETIVSKELALCPGRFVGSLLQIGGANVAGADRAWEAALFVVIWARKSMSPRSV
jgi:hypothetical protein